MIEPFVFNQHSVLVHNPHRMRLDEIRANWSDQKMRPPPPPAMQEKPSLPQIL